AGIVATGTSSGERMHKARHTAGQRVLDKTGNLKAVQQLLGHASIQTTADVYADWDVDQLAATLADVFSEDPGECPSESFPPSPSATASTPPAARSRRVKPAASTSAARPATRPACTPPTRRRPKRSSPSCTRPAPTSTACGCARSSPSSGAPDSGSTRRCCSP